MARQSQSVLFAVALLTSAAVAHAQPAPLEEARARSRIGQYDEALALLPDPGSTSSAVAPRLLRARILALLGRIDEGLETLEPIARGRHATPDGMLAYAELIANRGRPTRAVAMLDDVIERQPLLARAYYVRGRLRERLGQLDAAREDFQVLVEAFEGGHLTAAFEIAMVGEAYHRLARWEEANSAFAAALEQEPDSIEAHLGWAALLLDKYRPDQSIELAEEVLLVNPRHPNALLLRARALRALDQLPDRVAEQARAALAVNPNLPGARELLAELALDDEQYDRALELTSAVLAIDEARLESRALQAATYLLLDQRRGYRHAVRDALAINPRYAALYVTAADFASNAFRYDEALGLYERALRLDPDSGPANLGLGIGWSRQGDDERALAFLERALEIDPFDERAWRMVRFYEEDLASYEVVTSDHFRFRFHREERAILEAFVPPLLDSAYERYAERYAWTAEDPIAVEVFADRETFATRSAGLPHVEPDGICFGRLITARSPRGGDLNWAELLSHELSHAFSIAVSDARVPRWLGEGLAQWDTAWLADHWQRETDFALLARLRSDALPSIADLNRAFVRSHDLNDLRAAYAQSTLAVQFIASGFGPQAPIEMLRLFADRRRLADVLERVTGLDVAGFDAAFDGYLRDRLEGLLTSFEPNLVDLRSEEALETLVGERPEDPDAWAELAVARLQTRRIEGCEAAVERALDLAPRHPLATFVAGFLAIRERRLDDARALFEQILHEGHDGYGLRTELAFLSRRQGRSSEALEHYERALTFYPNGVEPLIEMADIYVRAGDHEAAISALQRAVDVDQTHYDAALQLAQLLAAEERYEEAADACERANHINPFDGERQGLCGRLSYRLGDWSAARRQLEAEIALGPADPADTERLLAGIDEHTTAPGTEPPQPTPR